MDHRENVEFIRQYLDANATCFCVAEEAAELVQTMCKVPRVYGSVFNPTPVAKCQMNKMVEEEIVDLLNALWVYGYDPFKLASMAMSEDNTKLQRWADRINAELEKKHGPKTDG